MKIYTKKGDNGETSLFGGKLVDKDDLRIEAYGTIDELNSFIGLAITECKNQEIKDVLSNIQNQLFTVGSDLASPEEVEHQRIKRTPEEFYMQAEEQIDRFDKDLEELKNFILPGGTKGASLLHVCRSICRRAERRAVKLSKSDTIGKNIVIFLNRLSDLFFVLARFENKTSGIEDVKWTGK